MRIIIAAAKLFTILKLISRLYVYPTIEKMSLELCSNQGDKFIIPSHAVPLLTSIKAGQESFNAGDVEKNVLEVIYQFVDEYSRMGSAEKKSHDNPRSWSDECAEYVWYAKTFGSLNMKEILELVNTSHALGFETLTNICSFHIAKLIKGKSPKEIREILNVPNDFSPEEEEELAKDNAWFIGS